jgi:hypothetical protein
VFAIQKTAAEALVAGGVYNIFISNEVISPLQAGPMLQRGP